MTGPLKGIRVVELAQIMAGPTCGMLLADMGADVIKVEKLPGGDDTRSYSRPSIHGESAAFMMLNRNKRGIAVNLKTPEGLEVVKRLLATADVVTENYRKGTLEKLGLGWDVLRELNRLCALEPQRLQAWLAAEREATAGAVTQADYLNFFRLRSPEVVEFLKTHAPAGVVRAAGQ